MPEESRKSQRFLLGLLNHFLPVLRFYIRYFPLRFAKAPLLALLHRSFRRLHARAFTARTRFGARIRGETKDILDAYLYCFGVWEPNLTAWLRERLTDGDVFVDVGANIGYFSLLAARRVGRSGGVVALEASPSTFARLLQHLQVNRCTNVRAVNVAASNRLGQLCLFRGPAGNRGEASLVEAEGMVPEAEVAAAPLTHILTVEERRRARVLKIDVEGAEWDVLEGLAPVLGEMRNDLEIIVEINPRHARSLGKDPAEILDLFRQHGFRLYRMPNTYHPLAYLSSRIDAPVPLIEPIEEEMDVLASRLPVGREPRGR